jgi:hypothetical protein
MFPIHFCSNNDQMFSQHHLPSQPRALATATVAKHFDCLTLGALQRMARVGYRAALSVYFFYLLFLLPTTYICFSFRSDVQLRALEATLDQAAAEPPVPPPLTKEEKKKEQQAKRLSVSELKHDNRRLQKLVYRAVQSSAKVIGEDIVHKARTRNMELQKRIKALQRRLKYGSRSDVILGERIAPEEEGEEEVEVEAEVEETGKGKGKGKEVKRK